METLAPSLEELKSLVSQYRYQRPLAGNCPLESRSESDLSQLIDGIRPDVNATIHLFTLGDTLNATHSSQNIVLLKTLEAYRARLQQKSEGRLPMLYDLFFNDGEDPEQLRIAMQLDLPVTLGYNRDGWYQIENGPTVNMCLTAVPRLTREAISHGLTREAISHGLTRDQGGQNAQLLKAAYEGAYLCALLQASRELYLVMPSDTEAMATVKTCHARYSRHPRSRLERVVTVTSQPVYNGASQLLKAIQNNTDS